MLRQILRANIFLSNTVDRVLPSKLREDGNHIFRTQVLPGVVCERDCVYDLGSGSQPFLEVAAKTDLKARVIGLDIDASELAAAPPGAYDETIVHDLCTYAGRGDADLVICRAALEHVPDTAGAISAIASTLKPGGHAYIFAPCRNAAFARINLILPESVKQKVLFWIFPGKGDGHHGFKAYYDQCTPSAIERLALANGLEVKESRVFWISSYFKPLFPAFVLWRFGQLFSWLTLGRDAAESFVLVLQRPQGEQPIER